MLNQSRVPSRAIIFTTLLVGIHSVISVNIHVVCSFDCARLLLNHVRRPTLARYLWAASTDPSLTVRICVCLLNLRTVAIMRKLIACSLLMSSEFLSAIYVGELFGIFHEFGNVTSFNVPYRKGHFRSGNSKYYSFNLSHNHLHASYIACVLLIV